MGLTAATALALSGQTDAIVRRVEQAYGLHFHNPELLLEALTDPSYVPWEPNTDSWHRTTNSRLEYYGDKVYGKEIVRLLTVGYPTIKNFKRHLIEKEVLSNKFLKRIADDIGLMSHVLLARGDSGIEERHGTLRPVLANILEALLAAIDLDSGEKELRQFFSAWIQPHVEHHLEQHWQLLLDSNNLEQGNLYVRQAINDPVGYLDQHISQPGQEIIYIRSTKHRRRNQHQLPLYVVDIQVCGETIGSGEGGNFQDAQKNAALVALRFYGIIP